MLVWLKRISIAFLVVLGASQVFRPAKTNPQIDPSREIASNLAVPAAVAGVLQRSCNDCHSDRTVWPWYTDMAPASWLVVSDVNRGRKALNFSDWTRHRPEQQQEKLAQICKEVSEGEMPGVAYTLMHRSTKLSATDVNAICGWTRSIEQSVSAQTREQ
jgi:Haem-binding domain